MRQPLLAPRAGDKPATKGLLCVCACKTHTGTQPTSSRTPDCVWKHHGNIIFLQLSGVFFERGGHEPADSQTSFQHSHTVFATGRPKQLHSQEANLYGRKHSRAHQQAVLKCLASSQHVDVRAVGNRVFFCTFLVCEDNMVPALHCARLNSTQLKHMLQPNARCLVHEGKRKEWRGKKCTSCNCNNILEWCFSNDANNNMYAIINNHVRYWS